jgi:hypothetical protein
MCLAPRSTCAQDAAAAPGLPQVMRARRAALQRLSWLACCSRCGRYVCAGGAVGIGYLRVFQMHASGARVHSVQHGISIYLCHGHLLSGPFKLQQLTSSTQAVQHATHSNFTKRPVQCVLAEVV